MRIRVLGEFSVQCNGREVSHFRSRRTAELLAYLALNGRRGHPREVLMELLWPEHDGPAARHSLSVALSWLRQEFEAEAHSPIFIADRYSVRLGPGCVSTDVAEFESALREAAAAVEPAQRLGCLERALACYGGQLLPGFYEDWVIPEQQRLEDLFFRAAHEALGLMEARGLDGPALELAHRIVAVDPLREESHREVLRLYGRLGRPESAERHYQAMARRLSDQFGKEPDAATRRMLADVLSNSRAAPAPRRSSTLTLEAPGGALPPESRFYIRRSADAALEQALERGDSVVLIKGARQSGKTSLLARGLARTRASGRRIASCHLRGFNSLHLESTSSFLLALAQSLCEQLELSPPPDELWEERRGPSPNFRRYLHRVVLASPVPLTLALDGADRLADLPFGSETFSLFRSWHDERALDSEGPWSRLTLVLAYSTEAHLLVSDLNQSPFNVGTHVDLGDFNAEQVEDLNERHGSPLRDPAEIAMFMDLVGGHPYLVRLGLHRLVAEGIALPALVESAPDDDGPFGGHLRRLGGLIAAGESFREALVHILDGKGCPDASTFHRLRSAGVVTGSSRHAARIRCGLYQDYLSEQRHGWGP